MFSISTQNSLIVLFLSSSDIKPWNTNVKLRCNLCKAQKILLTIIKRVRYFHTLRL